MFLASMLQVENKYGDLTILCLEHSIPLHKLWRTQGTGIS